MLEIAAAFAAAVAALGLELDEYRKTSHGPNPWTVEGLTNVIRISWWAETARELVNGKLNSCYRSPAVNKAAGGVETSYHQRGLATDIDPGLEIGLACDVLLRAAVDGKLGPVRRITKESDRGIVHIEWCRPGEPRPATLHIGTWP